ncbi:arsenic resistance N-acetyltransferase ArsN2 [Rhizobium pusense]|uniref:GNAT family N-acetyltransferase n=1 Tax=Agrobacterium pusense TaxID=648995 RepID=A0A4U1JT14_9HYPH|nr:arsenic resistance N-acetyltransferase ArsN2 [Agrobacterium pusense]ANV26242.1 acetyltransferase [Rhizobium sp. S41]KGE80295.1 acetyltransferase [Rhizobium sp. H41]MDH2092149.1 arsenic resistance N-acetyltransferase ArsN2 [Agrobacterium pusense]QIX19770.1 GNAT family N-acetyltransferase [Agrobacterium pusense]WCK27550.1 arsenic resistance N-acetyltransferase ArsN2 [Agrobacterium pusense]
MSYVLNQQPASGHDQDLQAALQAAGLLIDDLEQGGRTFFRFADQGQIVGFGGLESYGDCALLRSVVVLSDKRGRGYGEAISRQILDQAARDGARTVYLLTETATAFFEHLGFVKVDRATAPAAILQTRQAASLCPASAGLFAKTIQG